MKRTDGRVMKKANGRQAAAEQISQGKKPRRPDCDELG